jgi:outer membrane biosynthesis protein TonB
LGLALLALSIVPTRDPPTLAAFTQPKPPLRVTPRASVPQSPRAQVKRAAKKRVVTPPPAPKTVRAEPKPKPKAAAAPKPQAAPHPPSPPAPPPKRTYAWKPFSGAIYYQVSFARNGGAFYATQTRVPRVRLPAGLRFRPGRYSWTVRPAIVADLGIRLADPIIRRAFMVRRD